MQAGGILGVSGLHGLAMVAAAATAGLLTLVACPLVIRFAVSAGLVDEPRGWKAHSRPTPHLGGMAVMAGFIPAAALFGPSGGAGWVLLVGSLAFLAIGSLDDRFNLDYRLRIILVGGTGAVLGAIGQGWDVSSSDVVNVLASAAWLLVVVNAVNLLDLMDGVAAGTAAACAIGIAASAAVWDQFGLAAAAAALAASGVAFLRFNLARPSALFLGDGGSMSIGFLLAVSTMQLSGGGLDGAARLGIGAALLAVPLFDLVFRVYSRRRRHISLLTPGPDSVVNWLRVRLESPRPVTGILVLAQLAIGGLTLAAAEAPAPVLVILLTLLGGAGAVLIVLLHASWYQSDMEHQRSALSPDG